MRTGYGDRKEWRGKIHRDNGFDFDRAGTDIYMANWDHKSKLRGKPEARNRDFETMHIEMIVWKHENG